MESEDKLELYAAARVKDNSGKKHFFSYQIPQRKSFIYEHGEIITLSSDSSVDVEGISSGDNKAEELTEYSGTTSEDIERIETEYQVNRWRDFFHWCADGIDEALANSEAAVASLRAAAGNDELTSIAAGTHPLITYDYCTTFEPFGGDKYNGGRYNRTISRKSKAQYHIYSVHSFSTGSDYYLVQATLTTSPDHQETNPLKNLTDGKPGFNTHYHAGFTDYLTIRAYIQGAGNDPEKVALIGNIPGDDVAETETISKSDGWSFGGTIGGGYTQTPGLGINGSLSYSVSHNRTISYQTKKWSIKNECEESIPKFRAQFHHEWESGKPHHRFRGDEDKWQDIQVDDDTKSRIDYSTEWVWEVKKDFWQNRDSVRIIANPIIGERFAHGWGDFFSTYFIDNGGKDNGKATTIDVSMERDLGAPAPAHIYVSRNVFEASSAGSDDMSFEMLCNTNWKVESDADWCVMRHNTTGTDTGDRPEKIHFRVEPFGTLKGEDAKRRATIKITELLPNNRTGQTAEILVSQLPPEPHIDIRDTNLTAKDEGGTMSFNLKSSGKWTAESDSSWCVIDSSCTSGDATGSDGKAITFRVADWINAGVLRRATIKVTDDLGNYLNVYVSQGEFVFQVSDDTFTIWLGYEMTATESFILTCNVPWTVESGADWCIIDNSCKSGGTTGTNGRRITFKVNPDGYYYNSKTTTITVKAFPRDGSVKTKTINIERIYVQNK